jgi:hypothetical protein
MSPHSARAASPGRKTARGGFRKPCGGTAAVSVNLVLYGLIGPFAAALMDRFGIRRMMLASLAVIALGVAESARKRDFWLLAGSFFVCGATTNGLVGTHLVPACMDHGIPEVRTAGLLAGGRPGDGRLRLTVLDRRASWTPRNRAACGWRPSAVAPSRSSRTRTPARRP